MSSPRVLSADLQSFIESANKTEARTNLGIVVFSITLTDYSDATYVYHGGTTSDGGYRVKRYLKSDPSTNGVADDQGTDLANAWANRSTLTYS